MLHATVYQQEMIFPNHHQDNAQKKITVLQNTHQVLKKKNIKHNNLLKILLKKH